MWVTVMQIVFSALGTVPKDMDVRLEEREIRRRIKNIQVTALNSTTNFL